jgi:hypothetical protein
MDRRIYKCINFVEILKRLCKIYQNKIGKFELNNQHVLTKRKSKQAPCPIDHCGGIFQIVNMGFYSSNNKLYCL